MLSLNRIIIHSLIASSLQMDHTTCAPQFRKQSRPSVWIAGQMQCHSLGFAANSWLFLHVSNLCCQISEQDKSCVTASALCGQAGLGLGCCSCLRRFAFWIWGWFNAFFSLAGVGPWSCFPNVAASEVNPRLLVDFVSRPSLLIDLASVSH